MVAKGWIVVVTLSICAFGCVKTKEDVDFHPFRPTKKEMHVVADVPGRISWSAVFPPSDAIEATSDFSWSTLGALARGANGGNVIVSPWSTAECLSMVNLGARGKTSQDISEFLKQVRGITQSAHDLRMIRQAIKPLSTARTLKSANGLWVSNRAEITPGFLSSIAKEFGAKAHRATMPNPALTQINEFAAKGTGGIIPRAIDTLTPDDRVVLVNAVFFADHWSKPFHRAETKVLPFTLTDGKQILVPMMKAPSEEFTYYEDSRVQIVELYYASGLSMVLYLPRKEVSLDVILDNPKYKNPAFEFERKGQVKIPRWTSEFEWDIAKTMKSQGFVEPFFTRADFSGMSKDQPLYLTRVLQRARIIVNEEGTTAASTTAASNAAGDAPSDHPPFVFLADHPFFYQIRSFNGIVFFAGVVNNPA